MRTPPASGQSADGLNTERISPECFQYLQQHLEMLSTEQSDVISQATITDYAIEIELRPLWTSSSVVLKYLSATEHLGRVVTAYLSACHQLNVTIAVGHPWSMRIEIQKPISLLDAKNLTASLDAVVAHLSNGDALALTIPLCRDTECDSYPFTASKSEWKLVLREEQLLDLPDDGPECTRVAWLFHGIHAEDMRVQDPAFSGFPDDQLQHYLEVMGQFANPVVMSAVTVQSSTGRKVRMFPIMLPVTSQWMRRRLETRRRHECRALVQQGVEVARSLNCAVTALGQFTSITTRNGRDIDAGEMTITTGNSYATVLALQAIRCALQRQGLHTQELTVAIVGAAGNIGRACAALLAPQYGSTLLVGSGREATNERLQEISTTLPRTTIAEGTSWIRKANVILAAVNSVHTVTDPSLFLPGTVICDLSVPPWVSEGLALQRPDLTILKGGIAQLPFGEDLQINGFPLPSGQTFGCMAEGILLGLEGIRDGSFTGLLSPVQVSRISEIADRHGFQLAPINDGH